MEIVGNLFCYLLLNVLETSEVLSNDESTSNCRVLSEKEPASHDASTNSQNKLSVLQGMN